MVGRGKWHLAEKTESGIQQGSPTPLSLHKRSLRLCCGGDRGCQALLGAVEEARLGGGQSPGEVGGQERSHLCPILSALWHGNLASINIFF